MKKKIFAVALAAVMAISSAVTAFAADTVVGHGWWTDCEKSTAIALADGESVTFKVDVAAAEDDDTYAAFCAEVTDGTNYFTSTSAGDAWGAGDAVKNMVADAVKGGSYTVTVTRSGNDFTTEYVDNATGKSLHGALSLTGTADFGDTTVYIMGQVGTLTVEVVETPAAPAEDPTEAPAGDDAPATEAPAGNDAPATEAPSTGATQTGDVATAVMILAMVGAAAALVVLKKRVTE